MNKKEIYQLAGEIRKKIIQVVGENGGHLASNLGVVELTIAMHRVFNSPEDAFVWDVSHQAYTHKLLTGRYKEFSTLRRHGGLSGFTKRAESPHDFFDVGHSSTSVSSSLGLLVGRRLQNQKGKVIAVIGDGALTGGMAMEALSHGGLVSKDLIVILNDNQMSISENTGSLSKYLSKLTMTSPYQSFRFGVDTFVDKLPFVNKFITRINSIITENSSSKLIENIETEKEKLKSKMNKLIDLSLENAIDRETFLERKEKMQNQIEQLNLKQEKLVIDERNKTNRKLSLNKLKRYLENGEIITEFDKDAFEILVEQVIIGGYNEKDKADPKQVTFVLKNETKINYKDYLQPSNDISQKNLQMSNNTCGVLLGAISKRFDTIVEFSAFEDFVSYERKGKNKIKRVENHKIKVAIEVDLVCGAV